MDGNELSEKFFISRLEVILQKRFFDDPFPSSLGRFAFHSILNYVRICLEMVNTSLTNLLLIEWREEILRILTLGRFRR